ncbi:MAG TPA: hypothetical protein VKT80_15010, partial [Chloroflexota bacterium]|nr:hypothetical protein [Chloroflexota bacterium]
MLNQTFQGVRAAIWLDGDGSYAVFKYVSGKWQAPPGETARLDSTTATQTDSARYIIRLDNGASIGFRSDGWQVWTADVIGNRTRFHYTSGTTRIDSIIDPSGLGYNFAYTGGTTGVVSTINLVGAGHVARSVATLAYLSNRRLQLIRIPRDSLGTPDSTIFGYTADTLRALIDTVTDPRSTSTVPIRTFFAYDPVYYTAESETRPPNAYGAATAYFRDPLHRAVPRVGRGVKNTTAERLIYTTWYRGVYEDFTLHPMDFQVDPFLGTTYFRRIAPPAIVDGQFNIIDYGGDDVRRITRDTAGRVLQIEHGLDASSAPDSVIYHYDALGRIDSLFRSTLRLPNPANAVLDTLTFTWDTSATITATGARCYRLLTMHDAMGGVTKVNYGSTSGSAAQCLPTQTIGLAQDTTKFSYGALTVGDKAGARPVKVVDPNGLADSAAYDATTW